jgi:hypothetical protein
MIPQRKRVDPSYRGMRASVGATAKAAFALLKILLSRTEAFLKPG